MREFTGNLDNIPSFSADQTNKNQQFCAAREHRFPADENREFSETKQGFTSGVQRINRVPPYRIAFAAVIAP